MKTNFGVMWKISKFYFYIEKQEIVFDDMHYLQSFRKSCWQNTSIECANTLRHIEYDSCNLKGVYIAQNIL